MAFKFALFLVLVLTTATVSPAQSLDVGAPTPVRASGVSGRIAARDIGDSRLTDHYYAFTGTPGDLLITIQSTNLNGDLDVFTAVTLRPLLKLNLYAESTAPVTKGIYLRKREALILRIEARSPNDDEGTYKLFFGGSFEPLPGGPDIAEADTTEPDKPVITGKGTRRVTSAGARIAEPEPPPTEVAVSPTPEPTPEAKPVETPKPTAVEKQTEPEAARTTAPRSTRGRNRPVSPPPPTSRRQPTARTKEPAREPASVEEPKTEASKSAEPATPTTKPAPEPEPEIGPRLIIETNDGTLINRSMSGIRRVTIENGQVVVTGKDGKINRIMLANVVRMQIAP